MEQDIERHMMYVSFYVLLYSLYKMQLDFNLLKNKTTTINSNQEHTQQMTLMLWDWE